MSASFEADAVNAFNRVFVTNGFEAPFNWNASVISYVPGMPTCTFLEFKDSRIWCGAPVSNLSQIVVSSYSGFNNAWNLINAQNKGDPTEFLIQQNDGEPIRCLRSTPWGMFVGKRSSTHFIKGTDTQNYYQRILDPKIGCVDDRAVQMVDGVLVWPALDGLYVWDGAGVPLLVSREIEDKYLQIRQLQAFEGISLFTSQDQWQSGRINKNGPTDEFNSTYTPGSIFSSTSSQVDTSTDDFSGGSFAGAFTTTTAGQITMSKILQLNGSFEEPISINCRIADIQLIPQWHCDLVASNNATWQAVGSAKSCTTGDTSLSLPMSGFGAKYAEQGTCVTNNIDIQILNAADDSVIISSLTAFTTSVPGGDYCVKGSLDLSTMTVANVKIRLSGSGTTAALKSDSFPRPDTIPYFRYSAAGCADRKSVV